MLNIYSKQELRTMGLCIKEAVKIRYIFLGLCSFSF